MNKDLLFTKDDGLPLATVRSWAIKKYNLVYEYDSLFSKGMKNRWDTRVYIDLCSGPGRGIIKKENKILNTSPILSLLVPDKFDKYIFCHINKAYIDALRERVTAIHAVNNVTYLVGDSNKLVDQIIQSIPKPSPENSVLTFCFVDPFSLIIEFETIKRLSKYFMDFLVLLAFGMDGKRNIKLYIDENHERIDNFLSLNDWRERWGKAFKEGIKLTKFLADEFTSQMLKLEYRKEALNSFIEIRSDVKNLPLYYLAFFSRHEQGYNFWNKVKKRNTEPEFEFY